MWPASFDNAARRSRKLLGRLVTESITHPVNGTRTITYSYAVQRIIFPSVEQHLGRLRMIVTPAHRQEHIDGLVDGLVRVRDHMGGFD
ncbi:MAG: hypothetical protein IT422_28370 [Pirellulaceae bacterium]|nr:hypothetical protein [Pirellulaceae bacterium]